MSKSRVRLRSMLASVAACTLLVAVAVTGSSAGAATSAGGATTRAEAATNGPTDGTDWSVALTETAMTSSNSTIMGSWSYTSALFLYGEYLVYKRTGERRYLDYVASYLDRYVTSAGTLRVRLNSLDSMLGGNLLLAMYDETKQERYKTAATQIRTRLDTYPRTSDGGFWHMTTYTSQLWADGAFMVNPFLARYGAAFGDSADLDEAANQLSIYYAHLARPNGLLWHAYDESRAQPWADPVTGTSSQSWCRAVGWFSMATVNVLDVLPADHPSRPALITMVRTLARAFATYQDPASGRWFQVVDRGDDPANWTETSCSSMFTFVLSRGVQQGYLDRSYQAVADKGYQGVLARISLDATGAAQLTDICIGTNVSDYADYLARPRATNDLHGLGAFLIMNEQMRSAEGVASARESLRLPA